jgi:hypothetical protein
MTAPKTCPACDHVHPDFNCSCGCEYDTAFCGACGWLDCECGAA